MTDSREHNTQGCREVRDLLALFFDGELGADDVRRVSVHGAACPQCQEEIGVLDRLHVLVKATVEEKADAVDPAKLWQRIEARLPATEARWWERVKSWWEASEPAGRLVWSAAAAVAVAVLALSLYLRSADVRSVPQAPTQIAHGRSNALDVPAEIQQIETDFPVVTVMNDEAHDTAVIWVSDEAPAGGQW